MLLTQNGIPPPLILSTELITNTQGIVTSWKPETVVHVLNKNEVKHEELDEIRMNRPLSIVLGDSLDDANMASGDVDVLRIRVIDPEELTNPTHAALASAASFLAGALIPLLAIVLFPQSVRVPLTFASVLLALAGTGILSAKVGGAAVKRATIRVVLGGAVAMAVTFSIGKLFNVTV